MNNTVTLFILLIISVSSFAQEKNLLSGKYTLQELRKILIPNNHWSPFPALNDRDGWLKADQETLKAYLKKAESYLDYKWPYIPATKSLLIERTGDRNEYQSVSFTKREVLGTLLLAEIYENKGRFIDPIINGIWSVCEESFWGVPAHLPRTKEYSGLMDVSDPFVDLFAAETATFLAWADYFLGEKLDAVSPQIRKRIYWETNNRIFQPLMNKHHGWMSPNSNGRPPNNWNPWICSNWINTALLLERDEDKQVGLVHKALKVLDEFLTPYPQDGGCDEGPSYWGAAAASLYDNISLLNLATNNAFNYVFQDEKVRNMGRFIYRAQISEKYFLNFADADPQPGMSSSMIYRYGKAINDPDMMRFGAFYRKPEPDVGIRFHFFRNLFALFIQEEFKQAPQGLPLPKDVWLPDIQVMAARDRQGSTKGFYVAAKGGHNDESHNHNDIGNYVVYYDGYPLIIDVGRGTYTRKTFSDQRYEIWYNRSDYHNVPTINELTQLPGSQYRARDISYKSGNSFAEISLDISASYPETAGVSRWHRKVRLNRGKNVLVEDAVSLTHPGSLTHHLMTCYPTDSGKPGELIIHYKPETGHVKDFIVTYNPRQLRAVVEKVRLEAEEDNGILAKWGDTIYRINFDVIKVSHTDKFTFLIQTRQ